MTKMRTKTTSTNVKVVTIDKKTKCESTVLANEQSAGCCSFITRQSNSGSNKNVDVKMIMKLSREKMPEEFDTNEQITAWIDFVRSFDYDIDLKLPKTNKGDSIEVTVIRESFTQNYYFLFALNLIRYLWSTHYDHLPAIILDLRGKEELKHLSNWEIFQLGHKVTTKKHFNDMSPIDIDEGTKTNYITSDNFFKGRHHENLGGHLTTFNIKMPTNKNSQIAKLVKARDYLGIYNLTSTTVNKVVEVSKAKCLDNSNFESELNKGNVYDIKRVLKNTIKIKNKNYIIKLYNKKRFKLI